MPQKQLRRGDSVRVGPSEFVVLMPPGGEGYISRFLLADRVPSEFEKKLAERDSIDPATLSSRHILEVNELEA